MPASYFQVDTYNALIKHAVEPVETIYFMTMIGMDILQVLFPTRNTFFCTLASLCLLTFQILGDATTNVSQFNQDVTTKAADQKLTEYSGSREDKFQNLSLDCHDLLPGQYFCKDPVIDLKTQQAVNCSKETQLVKVPCYPVKGLYCNDQEHAGNTVGFYIDLECKYTNGHEFSIAVLLSVFLGWLGIDRFYLGYPAIGLLKLCTFGFMFLGHLVDLLLIAIQVVGPSDGSAYVVDYYGAGLTRIQRDNETYVRPPDY